MKVYCDRCGADRKKEDAVCGRCGKPFGAETGRAKARWLQVGIAGMALIAVAGLAFWLLWNRPAGSFGKSEITYSYVSGIGWKPGDGGDGETFTEELYKSNCADALPYEVYAGEPKTYQNILYAVTGHVISDEIADPETNQVLRRIALRDMYGNQWDALYYNEEGLPCERNAEVTLYGGFSGLTADKNLSLDVKYIDKW